MIHHYGTLAIDVDPRTGRGRVVSRPGDANGWLEAARALTTPNATPNDETAKLSTGTRHTKAPRKAQVALSTGLSTGSFDSKTELLFEQHCMVLKFCGELRSYTYHPFKIMLAPKRSYTPDFLLVYQDGHMVVVELKGSRQMKNARDSITRLHVAASRLPGFTWKLVERRKGQWVEEVVHDA